MKIKKLLFVLLAVLLVFSLFSCGKKGSSDIVDNPDDVTLVIEEPDLDDIKADKNTIEIDGKQYDISDTVHSDVPQKTEVLLTTEELHALFKKEYDTERYAKSNLYADQYKDFYMKIPARDVGTQVDANVYSYIESAVNGVEYEGKILPDDGFEQYVAWREALEGSSSGNSQSGNNSGNNSGNTNNETNKPSTKPSGGSNSNSNSGGSSNNGGSSGSGESGNVYEGAQVKHEVKDYGVGESSVKEEYEKPSYDIVG